MKAACAHIFEDLFLAYLPHIISASMNDYSSTNNTVQAIKRYLRVLHFYDSYAIISGNDIPQVSHMSVSVLWPTVSDLKNIIQHLSPE